jgi:hypothetical protein
VKNEEGTEEMKMPRLLDGGVKPTIYIFYDFTRVMLCAGIIFAEENPIMHGRVFVTSLFLCSGGSSLAFVPQVQLLPYGR